MDLQTIIGEVFPDDKNRGIYSIGKLYLKLLLDHYPRSSNPSLENFINQHYDKKLLPFIPNQYKASQLTRLKSLEKDLIESNEKFKGFGLFALTSFFTLFDLLIEKSRQEEAAKQKPSSSVFLPPLEAYEYKGNNDDKSLLDFSYFSYMH